jgi:eukaryotic-like serine/threonine-protein kinase
MLQEMDKVHRAGIIHNDIKMGNIILNSMGLDFKFYEAQLIDWNLALFYYTGLDHNVKRGTVCFYSPEELLRTHYATPARDIWSLGVTMFTYYT